jgi:hypothetical protein
LDIIKLYSKAKADQPNFEPGHLIDFDGIMVNNALVPTSHHELLQDSQVATPLQSKLLAKLLFLLPSLFQGEISTFPPSL